MQREVGGAAGEQYDLVAVGGGIYGASLAVEASRRGLRPLLLERDDFGGATSWNTLRILHGGLRYLQSLDLRRFRESVSERRWFTRTWPELVEPLGCLMPLYGKGLKRPSTFRAALLLNDVLSRERNVGVREDRHVPAGRVLDPEGARAVFPLVDQRGLKGGGLWHDALMKSSVRILIETLRWACHRGASVLNYVEAVSLEKQGDRVIGVRALDRVSGLEYVFRAERVINCAGPWCREVASAFDRDVPRLFRRSLAFNLLFDRAAVSEYAVAVTPPVPRAKAYFIVPWKGRMLAGTRHMTWAGDADADQPPQAEVDAFIDELNLAVPGLDAARGEVRRVYAGQLPAVAGGSAETRRSPVIHDHGRNGGPRGLVSVSGVKWTTARQVAAHTLERIYGRPPTTHVSATPPEPFEPTLLADVQAVSDRRGLVKLCRQIVAEESVVWLDDMLLRRMDGLDSDAALVAAVSAGLEVMRGRAGSEEEHLRRLLGALDRRSDKAAAALRAETGGVTQLDDTRYSGRASPNRTGTR
jgi:glycerol-3-phosphate dehydrogenase